MRIGNKVIALRDAETSKQIKKGAVYTITKVAGMKDRHGNIGVQVDNIKSNWPLSFGFFDSKLFRKVEPNFCNAITKELAEDFIEQDGKRELEIERVFTTKAEF